MNRLRFGQFSGNTMCRIKFGRFCILQAVIDGWKDAVRFSVLIKRKLLSRVEF